MKETIEKLRQEVRELEATKHEKQFKYDEEYRKNLAALATEINGLSNNISKLYKAIQTLTDLCDHDYEYEYKDREAQYTCKKCGDTYWEYC